MMRVRQSKALSSTLTSALVTEDHQHEQAPGTSPLGRAKKSTAAMCWTWFARHVRQGGGGGYQGAQVGAAVGDRLKVDIIQKPAPAGRGGF
jgi:hypothetical protein